MLALHHLALKHLMRRRLPCTRPLPPLLSLLAALTLMGCGGGGEVSGSGAAGSTSQPTATTTAIVCGAHVGGRIVAGTVSSVHDGDTITVSTQTAGSVNVRLGGIDAPELAQTYGTTARDILSARLLRAQVSVAYDKTDQYGRLVGAVFTSDCGYVNLDMVERGAAWYYKAYQCELSAEDRARFEAAQSRASLADRGLWAQPDPEAPWFFRNGSEPSVPSCLTSLPGGPTSSAPTPGTGTGVGVGAGTTGGSGNVPAGGAGSGPAGTGSTMPEGSTSTKPVCYTGPRGGTYTITPSGKKNYGGC